MLKLDVMGRKAHLYKITVKRDTTHSYFLQTPINGGNLRGNNRISGVSWIL